MDTPLSGIDANQPIPTVGGGFNSAIRAGISGTLLQLATV